MTLGASHGGAGAVAVFAVFVVACVVLVVLVVRFAIQISRRAGRPPLRSPTAASDVAPAAALEDDPDDGRDGEREAEDGRPEAEHERERDERRRKA